MSLIPSFAHAPTRVTLARGEGLEAAHNLIRVLERPVADIISVQRAANVLAAWRHRVQRRRTCLAAAFRPEDRAARRMHLRLQQRRVHVLYGCFRVLRAPRASPAHAPGLLRAARAAAVPPRTAGVETLGQAPCACNVGGVPRARHATAPGAVGGAPASCVAPVAARLRAPAAREYACRRGRAWGLPKGAGVRPAVCVSCGQ